MGYLCISSLPLATIFSACRSQVIKHQALHAEVESLRQEFRASEKRVQDCAKRLTKAEAVLRGPLKDAKLLLEAGRKAEEGEVDLFFCLARRDRGELPSTQSHVVPREARTTAEQRPQVAAVQTSSGCDLWYFHCLLARPAVTFEYLHVLLLGAQLKSMSATSWTTLNVSAASPQPLPTGSLVWPWWGSRLPRRAQR